MRKITLDEYDLLTSEEKNELKCQLLAQIDKLLTDLKIAKEEQKF